MPAFVAVYKKGKEKWDTAAEDGSQQNWCYYVNLDQPMCFTSGLFLGKGVINVVEIVEEGGFKVV